MIHWLHERAARGALNARTAYIQARLCASDGFGFDAFAWLMQHDADLRSAEFASANASALESADGSVFPGVQP